MSESNQVQLKMEDLLTEQQMKHILQQCLNGYQWQFLGSNLRAACDGMAGFLGDHFKLTLKVSSEDCIKEVHLFIKTIPFGNKPKADFITKHHYFAREIITFKLLGDIQNNKQEIVPWFPTSYYYNEKIIVMADLSKEGYSTRPVLEAFDLPHVLAAAASIARFHAAFINYANRKSIYFNRPYSINEEYSAYSAEPIFKNTPWLRAAAKLTSNVIRLFSTQPYNNIPDLELKLFELYLKACETLKEHRDTINTMIHKDLWANNIMFQYKNSDIRGIPCDALLIDFQCVKYAPPAFDLMIFLYYTTTRNFRHQHEKEVFRYYFNIFMDCLEDSAKERIKEFKYNYDEFERWCEYGRMFGALEAIAIFPLILMDPKKASEVFNNPDTYEKLINEDRTEPVVAYMLNCPNYLQRQLELSEEFLERYLLK